MKTLFTFILILTCLSFTYSQCNVEKKVDKFKDETHYTFSELNNVSFSRWVENGESVTYMVLHVTGSTIATGGKGAYVLLADGTKIINEGTEIDVEASEGTYYGTGDYEYGAFFKLSQSDIQKLLKSPVTDFKLYIFDYEVPVKNRDSNIRLKCIQEAK